MNKIRGLVERWRAGARNACEGASHLTQGMGEIRMDCADELEVALPKWTKIEWIGDYVNPETLPPEDEAVIWGNAYNSYNNLCELWQLPPKRVVDYTHWRPLCDFLTAVAIFRCSRFPS